MQHFFADRSWVQGDKIRLEGSDVNHMKNVLRMKEGEEVQVSDGTGNAYLCQIEGYEGNQAVLKIREKTEKDTELPSKIWLFQGLPKGDKMELIVQKAVELGVYGIVPFAAKRSVVRLDEKKAGKKQIRWQAIAKGAAEQSGRGLIPEVEIVKTYAEALEFAKELDVILVPYELEEGMKATMSIIEAIRPGQSVGAGDRAGTKCRSRSGHTWKKDTENRNCRNYDTFNFDVSSGVCRGSVAFSEKRTYFI